ncbi:MAG TPA: family 20 glycosylhydrolase [Terriglobales bacterium]|nr:family 20 glycosylhydrolase [Terriglobales bacterium]
MFKAILVFMLLFTCVPVVAAQPQPQLDLMPWPQSVRLSAGQLVITSSFSVGFTGNKDARLQAAASRFLQHLSRQTAIPLNTHPSDGASATLVIAAEHAAREIPELGEDESYQLQVTPSGARIAAPTSLGAMHALETLLQLVQPTAAGFAVPALVIHDQPRFPWRGLMLDVARRFEPMSAVKRAVDGMEAVKLNVLHLHLSDDQGFRVESKDFPRLQEKGSDGLYYTQDDIRDLVSYAADRGIRVVPEFDMPGHSISWFVGYPELSSGPGPYEIERTWGIHNPAMDPTRDSTYKFLDKFVDEMAGLFPDRYFHVGGDEVNGKQWDANPKIQEFMHGHGIKTDADLQAYFNSHLEKIVSKHHKIMIGWDEILRPDMPTTIVIQSWRGQASLAQAAKQGYRGLLSSGYYLDLMQPALMHYEVDPLSGDAARLSPEEQQRILGGEACLWSEYVSPENFDSRLWPRAAVVAERLWSPASVRDVDSMYQRLAVMSTWLEWLGNTHVSSYYLMLHRLAGQENMGPLQVLADVVEPVKEYTREDLAVTPATSLSPLNRLVDAVPPESEKGRQFADLVQQVIAGKASPAVYTRLRAQLTRWSGNDAFLQPLLQKSFLLKEVAPLSRNLSLCAETGLQALDYLSRGQHPPSGWAAQQVGMLQQALKPGHAQLLLMVAAPVESLVRASAGMPPTAARNKRPWAVSGKR